MDLVKQHVVLSLIRLGRYELDPETGNIFTNTGTEKRILAPIRYYTGYIQYTLNIGFNQKIMVYGHVFSYLATWLTTYNPAFVIDHIDHDKSNNRPGNLRCITQSENVRHAQSSGRRNPAKKQIRLPPDQKELIRNEAIQGISQLKLSEKYGVSRHTIASIIKNKVPLK